MPLPETIPVRFTEEDAEYVSVRPIKRQIFRLRELADMVLSVTGRDLARIQKIFHSGTIVYHFYRYSWQGFDADATELTALLSDFPEDFPDGDPRREFSAQTCTTALIESTIVGRQPVEIERATAERKALFASRSLWNCVIALAAANPAAAAYEGYSFARRADLYRLDLTAGESAVFQRDASRLAPRNLRATIAAQGAPPRIIFVSPRSN